MSQFLRITIEGDSPAISKRATGRVMRATNQKAAETWDRKHLRLHFLRSNSSRYGHKPRAKATNQKKRRLAKRGIVKKGGNVDAVHSGLFEETANRRHFVRATAAQATVPITTPSYIQRRTRKRINLVEELLLIIPRETRDITAEAKKTHESQTRREIANNRYRKRL